MAVIASASVTLTDVSDGIDGTGIRSTVVEYQAGASGTTAPTGTWKTTVDSTSASNPYLWTRVTYTYTDNSTKVVYSVGSTPEGIVVGGRNLAKITNTLHHGSAGTFTRDGHTYTISGLGDGDGIVFDSGLFEIGETYSLSFKFKKTNGTLTRIGGHSGGFTTKIFTIDGDKSTASFRSGQDMTDDTDVHTVVVILVFNGSGSPDLNLYIQPNRGGYNGTGMTCKFWDIMLEKSNTPSNWTPAPEDVDSAINSKIASVDVEYYLSTSATSLSGGSWVTTAPAWVDGKYMWSRTKKVDGAGNVTYSPSENGTCIAGAKGSTGSSGKGVSSIVEQYYQSTSATALSGGSWATTYPGWVNGKYIWTRSVITYTDGSSTTTTAVCVSGMKGDTGATGATGPQGKPGVDFSQGKSLFTDTMFASGYNSCIVYNNLSNGTVTVTRAARSSDNPMPSRSTSYELVVKNTGTALPGIGGIVQRFYSRANAVFIRRIIAKIPTGRNLCYAENPMGDGLTAEWLTSTAGTGKFTEYIYKYTCGASGTFTDGGYMYLDGSAGSSSSPVTWYIAYCATFDMTDVSDVSEAAKTATNFMELTSNGLIVGDKTASTLGRNILIGNSVIQFRNGTGTILAEYGDSTIYLGKNSKQSKIDLCNGMAEMYNEDSGSSYNRLRINAGHSIRLNAPYATYIDSYYNNGSSTIGETYIHMESYPIWDGGTIGGTIDLFASKNDHYNSMLSLHSQMANFEVNSADGTSAFLGLTNQGNNATLSASSEVLLTAPTITLSGTTTMNNGLRIENCGLELYYSTPFIDFHWNNSSADFTSRIIAEAADTLSIISSKLALSGNLYFNNGCGFSMRDNAGNSHHIMDLNGDNLLCLGYWTSMNNVGSTCIFGRDVNIIVGNADHTWMRPYIRKGDSIALQVDTAGYVTGSGRSLLFMVPLGRQIIGNPTVTASSGNGFIVRQNNKYCYGSSSTAWVYPSSYTVSKYGDGNVGVVINASMPNELNVTNNSPIGIRWNGTITFS